jgi:hypothetical protein
MTFILCGLNKLVPKGPIHFRDDWVGEHENN